MTARRIQGLAASGAHFSGPWTLTRQDSPAPETSGRKPGPALDLASHLEIPGTP